MTLKKLFYLFAGILISAAISCSNKTSNKTELIFSSDFENVVETYKQNLNTESINIYANTSVKLDSITTEYVQISILEPKELPSSDSEIDKLTYTFAQETYKALSNKQDFSAINVEIAFKEDNFCDAYRRINSTFTFKEIESTLAKIN